MLSTMAATAKSWNFPTNLQDLQQYVDLEQKSLWLCVFFIAWTPFMWNVLCRWEHNTRIFSKLFRSPKVACFCLSWVQILSANTRVYYLMDVFNHNKKFSTPNDELVEYAGLGCLALGMLFVVTSFLQLGWFGTWHGDHFGILLPAKVTGFPFNVLEHPMYVGGLLNFLGDALRHRSVAGLLICLWVQLVYVVTEMIEGPFTDMIYANAAKKNKKTKKSA